MGTLLTSVAFGAINNVLPTVSASIYLSTKIFKPVRAASETVPVDSTGGAAFAMSGVPSGNVDMPNLLSFIPPAPQLRPPLLEAINESYGKIFLLVQKAGPDSIKDDITLARKVLALMPILNTGVDLRRYRKARTGLHPDKFNSIPNITIYYEFKAGMLYKLGAAAKATIKEQPANDIQDAMPNPRSTDWSNNFHFLVTAQPWLAQPAWPEARDLPTGAPSLLERMA
ncbi:hypothetical protein T492DRAFT_870337, partial [Pavlovales sp. CCMP2436]